MLSKAGENDGVHLERRAEAGGEGTADEDGRISEQPHRGVRGREAGHLSDDAKILLRQGTQTSSPSKSNQDTLLCPRGALNDRTEEPRRVPA